MSNETVLTVVGNLTADPALRYTPSGAAVASFTIASTPRSFDRTTNAWKDGETLFLRCSLWQQQAAENAADGLGRGMRVIAQGRLQQRSYETTEGEKRTVTELQVDEIGPSVRYAAVKVTRMSRGSASEHEDGDAVEAWEREPAAAVAGSRTQASASSAPPTHARV